MTEQQARGIIITSTFVLLASTTGASLAGQHKLPANKTIVGGLFAMMGCAVMAEFSNQLGAYLAIAISGTGFIIYGLPTLEHYFGSSTNAGIPNNSAAQNTSGKVKVGKATVRPTSTGQLH